MTMLNLNNKFGPWAIITGASSGIGQGFANALAKQGFNLVLIARRENMLKDISDGLTLKYGTQSQVLALDLSDPLALQKIKESTKNLDIGLLISNAGGGQLGRFDAIKTEDLNALNQLNMSSHLELSHLLMSKLDKQHRPGGILFVSSTAGLQGIPYIANYAANKAYLTSLAEGLNSELKAKKIHVTALLPGPTSTPGFHDNAEINFDAMPMKPMSVDAVVEEGLKALAKNKPLHIAGRINRVMAWMGKYLLSRKVNTKMWGSLLSKSLVSKVSVPTSAAPKPLSTPST